MTRLLLLEQRITSLWEAEQHVYGIPMAGTIPSHSWVSLTSDRRVHLRNRAIEIWRIYLETDGNIVPHPPIFIPEYRQMLMHPDGELIVEEQ